MKARLLVALAAVVPRLVVLLHERGAILASNTEKSDLFASTFVAHGTFGFLRGVPSAYTQPLYGWFLIPVYWIAGRHWWSVGLAQAALAVATALLVYEVGRRWLSPRAGLIGAVAATLSPYLVWHDVHVNREIVDQVCAAALVLATLAAAARPTLVRYAVVGVVAGVAILGNTRLSALPLVLAAYLATVRAAWRPALAGAAVLLVAAGVAVSPWVVRNKVQVGCWQLTTDARALWKANNPSTHGVLARGGWIDDVPRDQPLGRPLTPEEAALPPIAHPHGVDECAQVPYYEHRVLHFWRDRPGEKTSLMAQAAGMLWSPRVTETTGRSGRGTSLDVGRRWVAPVYTGILFVLGAVGLVLVPRRFAALALLLLAYDTVAALAFAGATRYRVSWDFLLALLAGAAVERLWRRA